MKNQVFSDQYDNQRFCCGAGFVSCPELLENISTNYKYWSEQLRLEEEQEAGQEGGDTSAPGGSC